MELRHLRYFIAVAEMQPDGGGRAPRALVGGRLDGAFLRTETTFDLGYEVVDHESLPCACG